MEAFEYAKPTTTEEAVKLLGSNWGETEVLAGGTDLLSLMKDYASSPKRLVSLSGIAGLKGISAQPGGGIRPAGGSAAGARLLRRCGAVCWTSLVLP